jgi:hypothetical protein
MQVVCDVLLRFVPALPGLPPTRTLIHKPTLSDITPILLGFISALPCARYEAGERAKPAAGGQQ